MLVLCCFYSTNATLTPLSIYYCERRALILILEMRIIVAPSVSASSSYAFLGFLFADEI